MSDTISPTSAEDEAEKERRARCRGLARSGETKCKLGQVEEGVRDLEEALSIGTKDLKLLSIVCSQLGNAYIDLKEYQKAAEKHQKDQTLSRILKDGAGEAKACCNLACAYRLLGRFKDAIHCSNECVSLCRQLRDKEKEALAMYSLATCYHSLAKESHLSDEPEGEHSRLETTSLIAKAVQHYRYFLKLLDEVSKPPSYNTLRGRTFGNLGNLYYLQNNMDESVIFHLKRLEVAEMEEDPEAVIRAHSNIANAHLVGMKPDEAEKHYRLMEEIAERAGDKVSVSKALFGLATSFSIRRNYPKALDLYTRMRELVVQLNDEDGQLKVLFGMTFANRAIGFFDKAREFAMEHFDLAKQMDDHPSMDVARGNIDALSELIRRQEEGVPITPSSAGTYGQPMPIIPGSHSAPTVPVPASNSHAPVMSTASSTEVQKRLFEALEIGSRGRMVDQRAEAPILDKNPIRSPSVSATSANDSPRMRWKPLEKVKKRASLRLRPMNSSKHQPDLDMEAGISVSLPVSRTGSVKEVARTAPSKITENALGPLSSSGREESEEMDLADFLGMLDNSD